MIAVVLAVFSMGDGCRQPQSAYEGCEAGGGGTCEAEKFDEFCEGALAADIDGDGDRGYRYPPDCE